MRIFTTFSEAFGEIARDLKEMGITTRTQTMQDKDISNDPDFETLELLNYVYTVTKPELSDLKPTQPWADAEWHERQSGIHGYKINPGLAYKLREELWNEFLHDNTFAYTYSERWAKNDQVLRIINRLKEDPYSRQLYLTMWEAEDSTNFGTKRVPCSLGWHFMYRGDQLNMTYFMRSCDFAVHFHNDVYLALKLMKYVADCAGLKPGQFSQFMSSLHVYKKDVKDVF